MVNDGGSKKLSNFNFGAEFMRHMATINAEASIQYYEIQKRNSQAIIPHFAILKTIYLEIKCILTEEEINGAKIIINEITNLVGQMVIIQSQGEDIEIITPDIIKKLEELHERILALQQRHQIRFRTEWETSVEDDVDDAMNV